MKQAKEEGKFPRCNAKHWAPTTRESSVLSVPRCKIAPEQFTDLSTASLLCHVSKRTNELSNKRGIRNTQKPGALCFIWLANNFDQWNLNPRRAQSQTDTIIGLYLNFFF